LQLSFRSPLNFDFSKLASMADSSPHEDFSTVAMYAFCLLSGWWLTRWVIQNYVKSHSKHAHVKKMEDLDSQQQADVSSKMSEKKRPRRQAKKAAGKAAIASDGAQDESTKPSTSDVSADADEGTMTSAPTLPNLIADATESQIATADGDSNLQTSSTPGQPELDTDLPEDLQNQPINPESSSEKKRTRLGSGSRRRAKKAAGKAAIATSCDGDSSPIASVAHQSVVTAEAADDSRSSSVPEVSPLEHNEMITAEATISQIDTADGDLEVPTPQSETHSDLPEDSQHQPGKCEISSSEDVLTSASGKENSDDMDGSSTQSSADVQVPDYKLDWNDPLWETAEPPCLRFTNMPEDDDDEEEEEEKQDEQEDCGTAELPVVPVSNGPVYMPVGFINENQEYIAFMEPPAEQIGGVFLEPAILQKVVIDPAVYEPASYYPADCQSEHSPTERQMQAPAPGWSPVSSESDWAGLGERRGVQSSHSGNSWRSSFSRDDWRTSNRRSTPQRYNEKKSASPCNSWNNQVQHWDQPWGM